MCVPACLCVCLCVCVCTCVFVNACTFVSLCLSLVVRASVCVSLLVRFSVSGFLLYLFVCFSVFVSLSFSFSLRVFFLFSCVGRKQSSHSSTDSFTFLIAIILTTFLPPSAHPEPESLCNNWRGWKKQANGAGGGGGAAATSSSISSSFDNYGAAAGAASFFSPSNYSSEVRCGLEIIHELRRRKHWATRSFACSTLLARSAALIRTLAHSLTPELVGK